MGESSSTKNGMLKEFLIPGYVLIPGSQKELSLYVPSCPVLVFVNTKSGGQLGGALLVTYQKILNSLQVFDLEKDAPDKVLHKLYSNLERLKISEDYLATEIEMKLRLIVAGGDGTVS